MAIIKTPYLCTVMKKQLHATVIKSKCVTKNERKHYECNEDVLFSMLGDGKGNWVYDKRRLRQTARDKFVYGHSALYREDDGNSYGEENEDDAD